MVNTSWSSARPLSFTVSCSRRVSARVHWRRKNTVATTAMATQTTATGTRTPVNTAPPRCRLWRDAFLTEQNCTEITVPSSCCDDIPLQKFVNEWNRSKYLRTVSKLKQALQCKSFDYYYYCQIRQFASMFWAFKSDFRLVLRQTADIFNNCLGQHTTLVLPFFITTLLRQWLPLLYRSISCYRALFSCTLNSDIVTHRI